MLIADLFKSRSRLEAENLFLRHQLAIALRRASPRFRLRGGDRALLIWMTWIRPSFIGAVQVVQPETIPRWHALASEEKVGLIFGLTNLEVRGGETGKTKPTMGPRPSKRARDANTPGCVCTTDP